MVQIRAFRAGGRVLLVAAAAVVVVLLYYGLRAQAGSSEPSDFVSVTPCRVVDTRPGSTVGAKNTPLGENSAMTVMTHGQSGDCDLPSNATGVQLNVTAVGASAPTYLTVWPADDERPEASSLNPAPGQPPVPNAVATGVSAAGEFSVYNRFGAVHVVIDIVGYYMPDAGGGGAAGGVSQTDFDALAETVQGLAAENDALAAAVQDLESENEALAATVEGLESENAELSATLAGVVRDGDTLRFEGMDVQIVNGEEITHKANGLGNLILGYNEGSQSWGYGRSGSHNMVIGVKHGYEGTGGLVVGHDNANAGPATVVVGGEGNVATAVSSTILGGNQNQTFGDGATISGGRQNQGQGEWSSVSGGQGNSATGNVSSVSGGQGNAASGDFSSVSGGEGNEAGKAHSSILGGNGNFAGTRVAVAGGDFQNCDTVAMQAYVCGEGAIDAID